VAAVMLITLTLSGPSVADSQPIVESQQQPYETIMYGSEGKVRGPE
jgi:hypothetical protein